MVTHSSILAWKIPWTEEPGGLQTIGLQKTQDDWVTKEDHGKNIFKSKGYFLTSVVVLK